MNIPIAATVDVAVTTTATVTTTTASTSTIAIATPSAPTKITATTTTSITGKTTTVTASCLEEKVNYPGKNINGKTGNKNAKTNTANECQTLCLHTDGCNFFSWRSDKMLCWLKSKVSEKKKWNLATSGPKQCGK